MKVGAAYSNRNCQFTVWAPSLDKVSLLLTEENQLLPMQKKANGYWQLTVDGINPESKYMYQLSEKNRADPASHFQPDGVFGPSAVVDQSAFDWKENNWQGTTLKDMIIYELHVGTFSNKGTFNSAREMALELSKLGINTVELMPVSQFTGNRNWGYDVAFPYAVQNTYGEPDDLKRLVQEFHRQGVAVVLDVIYNHLGPEGNFLGDFGPYFLSDRQTPWGLALNFDGPSSEPVRNFFIDNALHWLSNYHLDGLRLDAVYAIIDNSPKHFLKELSENVECLKGPRKPLLIAENDCIDPKMIKSRSKGGFGLDGIWHDNLHHALHSVLTDERNWYYSTFGTIEKIIEALTEDGKINSQNKTVEEPEKNSPSEKAEKYRLVVFSQNHDQIGNRPKGERLVSLVGLEAAKLAAGIIILSQNTPLLFMGEEYAETSPFLFFTDYSDKTLIKNVQKNRRREAAQNGWKNLPINAQTKSTFTRSKIDWRKRSQSQNKKILSYYQNLISLRKRLTKNQTIEDTIEDYFHSEINSTLIIRKETSRSPIAIVTSFNKKTTQCKFPLKGNNFVKILDSAETQWAGPGSKLPDKAKLGEKLDLSPMSLAVYVNTGGREA